MPESQPSPESLQKAAELFELLLDADGQTETLDSELDLEVRGIAAELWANHKQAAADGFLKEPPAAVRNLWQGETHALPDGALLMNGRFLVVRMIGKGGMGEVYLARDRTLEADVAIKTIRRKLAADQRMRRQFITEIQTARLVNHRNVCRIHDLYMDTEVPFFSMEYLPGERLGDKLADGSLPLADRKSIALQLAAGLTELHASGLIHRDFKPANIILFPSSGPGIRAVIMDFGLAQPIVGPTPFPAGTLQYMAPEVQAGGPPTVKSDIYAFGKVLAELIPEEKWATRCQAERPEDRPSTLASVVRSLEGSSPRRTFLWTAAIMATSGAAVAVSRSWRPPPRQPLGRRGLLLNGFRAFDPNLARTLKGLIVMGLNQSQIVSLIPDETVKAALKRLKDPYELPVDRQWLWAAAKAYKIGLVGEGEVSAVGSQGLRLVMELFGRDSEEPEVKIDEWIRDRQQIVQLAEKVAYKLRVALGESAEALFASHKPLDQTTSTLPEVVDLLMRGIEKYEQSSDEAITLFNKAAEIDPQCALAWAYSGMAATAEARLGDATPRLARAFDLRNRLAERERLWIEELYYNNRADFHEYLRAVKELVALYPGSAMFQRQLAFAYAARGFPKEAVEHNRKAVELDPEGNNNQSELVGNLAEANLPDEALQAYREFREHGNQHPLLEQGAARAHMSALRFVMALDSLQNLGAKESLNGFARLLQCIPLIVMGRFSEAETNLSQDLRLDIAQNNQWYGFTRRVWLAHLSWMMDAPFNAKQHIDGVLALKPLPAYLDHFREVGLAAIRIGDWERADHALRILEVIEREALSAHSKGSRLHMQGVIRLARGEEGGFERLDEGFGLWDDPLARMSLMNYYLERKLYKQALPHAKSLFEQRGRIFKRYFPGWFLMNQLAQARILAADVSSLASSLRTYKQIHQQWQGEDMTKYKLGQEVLGETRRIQTLLSKGGPNG